MFQLLALFPVVLRDIRCTYRFRRLFSQSENHPDTLAAPTQVPVPSKATALDLLAVARHRNRLQQLTSGITAAQGIAQTRSRGTIQSCRARDPNSGRRDYLRSIDLFHFGIIMDPRPELVQECLLFLAKRSGERETETSVFHPTLAPSSVTMHLSVRTPVRSSIPFDLERFLRVGGISSTIPSCEQCLEYSVLL